MNQIAELYPGHSFVYQQKACLDSTYHVCQFFLLHWMEKWSSCGWRSGVVVDGEVE